MASFEAEIGWKRLRNRENKNYRSVPFLPTRNRKLKKKSQINSKNLKNTIMASFQAKIDWGWPRKREKKIIVPFRSYPTRNRKF